MRTVVDSGGVPRKGPILNTFFLLVEVIAELPILAVNFVFNTVVVNAFCGS